MTEINFLGMSQEDEDLRAGLQKALEERGVKWPYNGWAPGEYVFKCRKCTKYTIGTKRGWNCLPCAIADTIVADQSFNNLTR